MFINWGTVNITNIKFATVRMKIQRDMASTPNLRLLQKETEGRTAQPTAQSHLCSWQDQGADPYV